MSVSEDDKNAIKLLLGQQSSALVFSVARLYQCSPVGGDWRYRNIWGIVVLVIDRGIPGKPYFIRMFDVKTKELVFSEELYIDMEYEKLKPLFHTFCTRSAIVGLSFVKSVGSGFSEADHFFERVVKSIPREELASELMEGIAMLRKNKKGGMMSKLARFFKTKSSQVSGPTAFVHKTHISFDANQGEFFAQGTIDGQLAEAFNKL